MLAAAFQPKLAPHRPARRSSLAVRASMPVGPQGNPQVRASAVPGPEEDREVAHAAFMSAYGQSHHGPHIKGMQEFAGALLARQRIPSGQYADPLGHIFDEFDKDRSGTLSAEEVAEALRSRNVNITDKQAEMFIDAVDFQRHAITKDEFRELIMHMAAADLHSRRSAQQQDGQEWVMSSWEQDEEIVTKLKSWTDHLMARRFK